MFVYKFIQLILLGCGELTYIKKSLIVLNNLFYFFMLVNPTPKINFI